MSIEYPPEAALYEKASSHLVNIPKDFNQLVENSVKNDYQLDKRIIEIILENKKSIKIFKDATRQKSDGFIFGKRPKRFDAATKIPVFFNKIRLFKLLLLEGREHISNKLYDQVADNYLAAARFLYHLSQQRFSILITSVVQISCLDLAYPCLLKDIQSNIFSKDFYRELLDILMLIRNNQDFLKSAFEEDLELMKNSARMIEEGTNKQDVRLREKLKKLNVPLDSEFFEEYYKIIDHGISDLFKTAIFSAESNNPEIYEKKFRNFHSSITASIKRFRNPLSRLLYVLKKMIIERKSRKLIVADTQAKIFLMIAAPQFTQTIRNYHVFYNNLNVLITALAVKMYQLENGTLPNDLNQLMPKYLEFIPEDTYNNFGPLSYKKEGDGFIIYSFGPDKKDNNGIIEYNEESKDKKGDIIFSSF